MFVIVLDKDLEIFDYTKPDNPKLLYELIKTKHTLELSTLFESIWQDLWVQGLNKATEIYYIVGENASFTDNRMVFIWLKSWRYFGGTDCNYTCAKAISSQLVHIPSSASLFDRWLESIMESGSTNPEDLDYLKEPRITVKAVFG
jgi:hypothetical protein